MVFRPLKVINLWEEPNCPDQVKVKKHIDKGYYYKFNCQNEIRLVKLTLEDNGFLPQPYVQKQMSTTFSQIHANENRSMRKQGDDWLLMWSTKALKVNQYCVLKKYQKVNQFPKSYEITRKDLLVERIQKMQEMYHGPNFDFIPETLTLPRESSKLQALMRQNPQQYWIVKPAQSSQGKGIYITNDFNEIQ